MPVTNPLHSIPSALYSDSGFSLPGWTLTDIACSTNCRYKCVDFVSFNLMSEYLPNTPREKNIVVVTTGLLTPAWLLMVAQLILVEQILEWEGNSR